MLPHAGTRAFPGSRAVTDEQHSFLSLAAASGGGNLEL